MEFFFYIYFKKKTSHNPSFFTSSTCKYDLSFRRSSLEHKPLTIYSFISHDLVFIFHTYNHLFTCSCDVFFSRLLALLWWGNIFFYYITVFDWLIVFISNIIHGVYYMLWKLMFLLGFTVGCLYICLLYIHNIFTVIYIWFMQQYELGVTKFKKFPRWHASPLLVVCWCRKCQIHVSYTIQGDLNIFCNKTQI